MKKLLIFTALLGIAATGWSCSEDKLDPNSVIVNSNQLTREFDSWLMNEFKIPYNIDLVHRADAKNLSGSDATTPAKPEGSKIMAVLLKHLWLDAYSEVAPDGVDFIKAIAPRQIDLYGAGLFDINGSQILGSAVGGKKMNLYDIDSYTLTTMQTLTGSQLLSPDTGGVFHTIHHEFVHILHQNKPYESIEFQAITPGVYNGNAWGNYGLKDALDVGCITPYGRSSYIEDFTEIFSTYIGFTPEEWAQRLDGASEEGRTAINTKLEFIRTYLKTEWGLDINKLRDVIVRRAGQLHGLYYLENLDQPAE